MGREAANRYKQQQREERQRSGQARPDGDGASGSEVQNQGAKNSKRPMQSLYQRHVQRNQEGATQEYKRNVTDDVAADPSDLGDSQSVSYAAASSNPLRTSSLRTDLKDKLSEMKRLIEQQRKMHKEITTTDKSEAQEQMHDGANGKVEESREQLAREGRLQ